MYLLAGARFDDLPSELQLLHKMIGVPERGKSEQPADIVDRLMQLQERQIDHQAQTARDFAQALDRQAHALETLGDKIAGAVTPVNPTMLPASRGRESPPAFGVISRDENEPGPTTSGGLNMDRPRPARAAPQVVRPETLPEVWTDEMAQDAARLLVSSVNNYGRGKQ